MAPQFKAPRPVAHPTKSYWLSQTSPDLSNYCSHDALPDHVDTIVIGSGITGALIAHEILQRMQGKSPSIMMVEARELASGATGRNGGHIKPDCYKNHRSMEERYGADIGRHITSFEPQNMKETVQFIKDNGLEADIDLVETRSADVYMSESGWNNAVKSHSDFARAGGDVSDITLHEAAEAREKFRINGIYGAVSYPACSLWPHKLATKVIERCIAAGLQVFTNTRVNSIVRDSNKPNKWRIHTTRGAFTCDSIYHATNAHAASLLPTFHRSIVPVKGHVAAIEPPSPFLSQPLINTYGIQWGEDFDYLIQRSTDGFPLIYGGRDLAHKNGLPGVIGDWDDSKMTPEIITALRQFPFQYFQGWNHMTNFRYVWSGIMGFTADTFPFVGELPGLKQQYIAAGFNGHGMARVFLSARAVVQLAFGESVDPRVPPVYYSIASRLSTVFPEWETLLDEASALRQNNARLPSVL
ncbi:FAD dependent oxidoreductase [Aaosphaeria arxii CBS 175.79]|uniref:FAD dependent oxidoreductase n=1 Tax=Aaosphaeria arxii CBS 175.79 TaxID=1450172 RepID=A0A6A5X7W3_9PLEO|nr:FAD dependent oxidoreductase [Aaosphaeria arxii CBS 175.79]KAF2009033.1 FAD dependent oxidoreductase [Aaosphaeria arxii CBS 175.79]